MKKVFFLLSIILISISFYYRDIIIRFIGQHVIYKNVIVIQNGNEYYKNSNFLLAENTNEFIVKEKEQFLDIIYTILNNGWDKFSFICDYTYETCGNDFLDIVENTNYTGTINNYINPLNAYKTINFSIDNLGKITITIEKNYTKTQIIEINKVIDRFINKNLEITMNDRQKIRLFHDFIIENSVYDQNYSLDMDKNSYYYHPYNAYGPLVEGKGICSGYSDAMAIFLDKIGVKNYRIASDEHIWNFVYLDSTWYHLDLTWDDPVTSTGEQVLLHDFFLITTNELKRKNTNQHSYDYNLYLEAK